MKQSNEIRKLYWTKEFSSFFEGLLPKVQEKFDYVFSILRTEYTITTKFVKHLENTDLYEMRVSVGSNEYRTVLFAMDNDNIILATKIILLNAFLKKSSKDYNKNISKALKILGGIDYDKL